MPSLGLAPEHHTPTERAHTPAERADITAEWAFLARWSSNFGSLDGRKGTVDGVRAC